MLYFPDVATLKCIIITSPLCCRQAVATLALCLKMLALLSLHNICSIDGHFCLLVIVCPVFEASC